MEDQFYHSPLHKKIQDDFEKQWKEEMDDVNYIDGIVFALKYLEENKLLK